MLPIVVDYWNTWNHIVVDYWNDTNYCGWWKHGGWWNHWKSTRNISTWWFSGIWLEYHCGKLPSPWNIEVVVDGSRISSTEWSSWFWSYSCFLNVSTDFLLDFLRTYLRRFVFLIDFQWSNHGFSDKNYSFNHYFVVSWSSIWLFKLGSRTACFQAPQHATQHDLSDSMGPWVNSNHGKRR